MKSKNSIYLQHVSFVPIITSKVKIDGRSSVKAYLVIPIMTVSTSDRSTIYRGLSASNFNAGP